MWGWSPLQEGTHNWELSFIYSLLWFQDFVCVLMYAIMMKPKALVVGCESSREALRGKWRERWLLAKSVSRFLLRPRAVTLALQLSPHCLPLPSSQLYPWLQSAFDLKRLEHVM